MAERNRIALIQEVRVVHVWKARPSLCPVCALLSIACSRTLVISLFCIAWNAQARARACPHDTSPPPLLLWMPSLNPRL